MYPSQHFFFGVLFSLILLMCFPQIGLIGASLILFSSVLIDVDHYFYFVGKKKDLNLFHAYRWFKQKFKAFLKEVPQEKRKEYYSGLYCFHGLEVLILLSLLGVFVSPYFLFICTGFAFHLFLDMISDIRYHTNSHKLSLVENMLASRSLKQFQPSI